MARNIEIKARSRDFDAQARTAAGLAGGAPSHLFQEDTFFHVPRGRLKLRDFGDGTGELIQYHRADAPGPKQSDYARSATREPGSLKQTLTAALGVRAVVRKHRTVFLVGQTRVHLDEVEGVGRFIELEVVLGPGETAVKGSAVARNLMSALGIRESDLVAGAYVDLLVSGDHE